MDMIMTVIVGLLHRRGKKRERDILDGAAEFETDNLGFPQQDQLARKRRKEMSSEGKTVPVQSQYENMTTISGWLEDDKVNVIGVHGMGGIGKTTLAKKVYSRLENHAAVSSGMGGREIAWVSVGSEFTINSLQHRIAEAVGLDFQDEKDLNRRAASLYAFLLRLSWRILFLDDLWGHFRLEQVGIPKQCKLILISRSLDVCRAFRCQKFIKIHPLSREEAWQQFYTTVGDVVLDSKENLLIGKKLCDLCGGVPLAINGVAKRLRGVADVSGWVKDLDSINQLPTGETGLDDTLNSLRLSYNFLNAKLKECFLYCALYPKGDAIWKEDLIRLWIGEALIDDVESLQTQYDMGHSILNKLLNSSVLESSDDESMVKMHDLIKCMALSVAGSRFSVIESLHLMKNPMDLHCPENVEVVCFIKSVRLVKFDAFPKLSTLHTLFLGNSCLYELPDSVFVHMTNLRVLNLAHTFIDRLPSSISNQQELRYLDISYCSNLKQVPSFGKLKNLRYLNLMHCAVRHVLPGLHMLEELKELNLCSTFDQPKFQWDELLYLSKLKRLSCGIIDSIKLQSLKSLESLDVRFANCIDLSKYVKSHHWSTLKSFHLQVGNNRKAKRPDSKAVSLHGCSLNDQAGESTHSIVLPDNIQEFNVDDCEDLPNLTNILNLECDEMSVETGVCKSTRQAPAFSGLETCSIRRCHDVTKLFTASSMQKLPYLKSIEIEDCEQLKEVIAEEASCKRSQGSISLPRLQRLILARLPQLKSICKRQLVAASLKSVSITDCPKLKTLPFFHVDIHYGI